MPIVADPSAAAPSLLDWREITGDRTALVLAVHPGDETRLFGGLIARTCAAGRPPFVAVLTDGSTQPGAAGEAAHRVALRRERETRAAAAALGLEDDRLLFVGLFDGTVPADGPMFDAVVAAMDLVMWRNDCHVLVAAEDGDTDTQAAAAVARAVARRTGLGVAWRTDPATGGGARLRSDAMNGAGHPAATAHLGAGLPWGQEAYVPDVQAGRPA